jgi:hypothetical protein
MLVGTLALVSCSDGVSAPESISPKSTRPRIAATSGRVELPARAKAYKRYLGASSYRLFFGKRTGGHGFSLPGGAGRGQGPSPNDFSDQLVNDRSEIGLGQSEVTLAAHGGTIVVGWNDATGFYQFDQGVIGWGLSPDGGNTFIDKGGLPRIPTPGFLHGGDPGLAVDQGGTFYFTGLCFDFDTGLSGICLTIGRRSGNTISWRTPIYAASSLSDLLDKPFIAVSRDGRDVYVSYTRFSETAPFGQIEVVTSHDAGNTVGAPVVVGPAIDGVVNQGSEPAVGPGGEVYVIWERGWLTSFTPDIVASRSLNQGASFSVPVVIRTIASIAFSPPAGYNRPQINDFPRIAVARTGPHRGEVYAAFHDASAGTADVYLSRSSNGVGWSAPVRINDQTTDYQFWPTVSVEPGGNVDVLWYDRRLDPGTAITNTFWSQSVDGGSHFRANVRLSDVGSNWATAVSDIIPNFGDYNDIATGGNRTFAAWGDGRLGDPDVFFSELRGTGKRPETVATQ